MRRLDLGMASYGKERLLPQTIEALQRNSTTDWRLFVIDNPHPRVDLRETIAGMAARDPRIIHVPMEANVGYAGAVNELFRRAETEYIGFVDDDATIATPGWDELLCGYLDRFHEIGMIFPNGGPYPIDRGAYTEVMWGVGFCWVINRMCMSDVGSFDETLGHQEEADYCQRVRMAGWKCAAALDVHVRHEASASNDPAAIERINRGVVNWVNKWNHYFNGKNFNYHSPNVTRFEDWPPQALYLEEWWKLQIGVQARGNPTEYVIMPLLNDTPTVVSHQGREYDLIRVPRFKDFYRGRII